MSIEFSNRVWESTALKGGKKLVMLALADHADKQGECYPGTQLLMEKTGLTDRQLRRIINDLANDGYISIESRAIGRGKHPHYRLFPREEKRTLCPEKEEKADISCTEKRTFRAGKADISDAIQSHARSEPQEPNIEPREKHALPSRNCASGPKNKITFKSPHVNNDHFDIGTGFIAEGTGATPVEVYYERFDVQQNGARLNAIKEDDLVRYCKDLDRLREVITAYSQTNYLPGNVRLILDWYRDGVPEKHRPDNALQKRSNSAMFLNFAAENGVFYGRTTENQ